VGELSPDVARGALSRVAGVREHVSALIGLPTPTLGVVLYEPCGVPGAAGELYLQTLAVFGSDGRVTFRYPWLPDGSLEGSLVGTAAHEVAEAAVLDQVTVLDPYLRWVHDGIAEALEHAALRVHAGATAKSALEKNLLLLRQRREDGVDWVDLTRWRQVAPWLVRSHRFFPSGTNLSLDDLAGSRHRVAVALAKVEEPALRGWLFELEEVLRQAAATQQRPWREGEGRPADTTSHDLIFYTAALAVWLEIERQSPGATRRYLGRLREARLQDQHVLRAAEATDMLRQAAPGAELPDLTHVTLSWVEAALSRELAGL
jgi:hypothetical protein